MITVRSTAFEPSSVGSGSGSTAEVDASGADAGVSSWVSESLSKSDRPELGSAKVVVSGGRGLGSKENFDMMYNLADKLNAAGVTSTQPGWVEMLLQLEHRELLWTLGMLQMTCR